MTGFTFPGMIEDPGWVEGSVISPMPQRGPDASHRMSCAIFQSDVATVRRAPDASIIASFAACASKWFSASRSAMPVVFASFAIVRAANSGCVLIPVPTAVPPRASSPRAGSSARTLRIDWFACRA